MCCLRGVGRHWSSAGLLLFFLEAAELRPCQGGSQVDCRNFKMSCVGILSRVHVAVGN